MDGGHVENAGAFSDHADESYREVFMRFSQTQEQQGPALLIDFSDSTLIRTCCH